MAACSRIYRLSCPHLGPGFSIPGAIVRAASYQCEGAGPAKNVGAWPKRVSSRRHSCRKSPDSCRNCSDELDFNMAASLGFTRRTARLRRGNKRNPERSDMTDMGRSGNFLNALANAQRKKPRTRRGQSFPKRNQCDEDITLPEGDDRITTAQQLSISLPCHQSESLKKYAGSQPRPNTCPPAPLGREL